MKGLTVGLIMADADRWRALKNAFHSVVGDTALSKLVSTFPRSSALTIPRGCCGGEEFLIVICVCGTARTIELADRVGGELSIRKSESPSKAGHLEALLHAADVGMYAAKRRGVTASRNRGLPAPRIPQFLPTTVPPTKATRHPHSESHDDGGDRGAGVAIAAQRKSSD